MKTLHDSGDVTCSSSVNVPAGDNSVIPHACLTIHFKRLAHASCTSPPNGAAPLIIALRDDKS